MKFTPTEVAGAFVVEIEKFSDARGWFARTWCARELEAQGLETRLVQCSASFNHKAGTLRGMHYQAAPHGEVKLVRATSGSAFDVAVDLRPESPTYLEHVAVDLNEENQRALYVPERFAHGYQTLVDNTHTSYQVGEFYAPQHEGGLKFDDPRLGLDWPLPVASMSPKDAQWKLLGEVEPEVRRRMSLAPAGAST